MRRQSFFSGAGLALLASPTLAHVGDHGEHGTAHFLADHGLALGGAALVVAAAAAFILARKKG